MNEFSSFLVSKCTVEKSLNSLTEAQVTRNETGVNDCLGILNHMYDINIRSPK